MTFRAWFYRTDPQNLGGQFRTLSGFLRNTFRKGTSQRKPRNIFPRFPWENGIFLCNRFYLEKIYPGRSNVTKNNKKCPKQNPLWMEELFSFPKFWTLHTGAMPNLQATSVGGRLTVDLFSSNVVSD